MSRRKSERVEATDENASFSPDRTHQRRSKESPGGKSRRRKKPGLEALTKWLREGLKLLKKKRHGPIWPETRLKKDAGSMEFEWTREDEKHLRRLLEKEPEHFRALHALVEGRDEEVTKQQRRDLRGWGYLSRDLAPLPGVKAVMSAAVRQTPDGLCLVDPIDIRSDDDAKAVQRLDAQREEQYEQGLERLSRRLRKRRPNGNSEGTDRSR
jgi:hypothetical protein